MSTIRIGQTAYVGDPTLSIHGSPVTVRNYHSDIAKYFVELENGEGYNLAEHQLSKFPTVAERVHGDFSEREAKVIEDMRVDVSAWSNMNEALDADALAKAEAEALCSQTEHRSTIEDTGVKIGDKVRLLRCDPADDKAYPGYVSSMLHYADRYARVLKVYPASKDPDRGGAIRVSGNNWWWRVGQFEIVQEAPVLDLRVPGAKADHGKVRPSLIINGFPRALLAVAEVGTFGANKYSDGGWQHVPNSIQRYTDAMLRHHLMEAAGETVDAESGLEHAAHRAWNALAVLELMLREQEKSGHD